MPIPNSEAELAELCRSLGAPDAEQWAHSQVAEDIPQLLRFLFLKHEWAARACIAARSTHVQQLQGASLAQPTGLQPPHAFALGRHGAHFPLSTSRNASTSSILFASSFFSLLFSASSVFSRCASDTFMPPNFAFQA